MSIPSGQGLFEKRTNPPSLMLYNFDIGGDKLKDEHKAFLRKEALPILRSGGSVRVIGLADRRGTRTHNQVLSEQRVARTVEFLRREFSKALLFSTDNPIRGTGFGEDAAARAGEKDETYNPRFRAVLVFLAPPVELVPSWDPPRFYRVSEEPSKWTPPAGVDPDRAKDVVKKDPWQHSIFPLHGLFIRGRREWGAADPIWGREVIYYNIKDFPLNKMLHTIVVHHTANDETVSETEKSQTESHRIKKHFGKKEQNYAAIGYHFFIDKDGTIFEGRPLEVMGSNAGEGLKRGPENDPDFGAIGIVMQGNYHYADNPNSDDGVPRAQLKSLEDLIGALRVQYPSIRKLLMHREVVRKVEEGEGPEVCPGDRMAEHVDALRKKFGL